MLFEWKRFSTALALAVLAQEEFAKAFILHLVMEGALPWTKEVRQSISKHQCKHLLAIVMEWLPSFDDWVQTSLEELSVSPTEEEAEFYLPDDVSDALNIYRHEEIERIRSGFSWKEEEWATGNARKIADGKLDRKKQSALYVDITKTGEVGLNPDLITSERAAEAIQRAERLSDSPLAPSAEYRQLKAIMTAIFENLRREPIEVSDGPGDATP